MATLKETKKCRKCRKCGKEKPLFDFDTYIHHNGFEYTRHQCRECRRKYKHQNPEKVRNNHYQRTYGITLIEYELMLKSQNGVCKICGQFETAKGNSGKILPLSIDHEHKTGKIRGLLCAKCNKALGLLNSDIEVSKAITKYLEEKQ